MKENNMMSYEMYEDFKETMVKTIKTELAAKTANNNQSSDNDLSYHHHILIDYQWFAS